MQSASLLSPNSTLSTVRYSILGVQVAVASDVPSILQRVDETYTAFRHESGAGAPALEVQLRQLDDTTFVVRDSCGYEQCWPRSDGALLDLLERLVHGVLANLQSRGVYAIHAGATVYRGTALLAAGRSGQGKTTLVLGLLRRGLGLLSDEFAVADPITQQLVPYRRSLHIRPGTPELIPELGFLQQMPQQHLGGGIEWTLSPQDLDRAFPGCLASAAPLRYVILMEGTPRADGIPAITPVSPALATMELLRGTWGASINFAEGLARVGRLLNNVACARLRVGALEPTLACILTWLEASRG